MKKFISLFFVLCFVFCFTVPVYADATEEKEILDSGQCGESLYWELDSEGLLRIFGTGPMYDYNKYYEPSPWYKYRDEPYISEDGEKILDSNGDIYLSAEGYYANNPNGYKVKDILIEEGVTYIGDWAFYRVCVDKITVPEGVEATGIFCFRYSPTLKELTLPDSLKVLDDYAISRNYELEVVNIGNSLETIGTAGFNHNPSLKRIVLPDTCTTINKQLSPAYAAIDYSKVGLMENCSSLEYVYFGNVTDIPQRTCLGASLKSVVIPNTVKKIDTYAFYACESLEEVIFEDGAVCTEINNTAFSGCTSLKRVKGGTALEKLGLYTSVVSLEEFDFSSTNTELYARQFLGTSLKEVTVSDKITTIPVACFNSMKSLEKIYLPGTLTEIMASSFNYCESLKDIYFDGTQTQWWSVKKASGWSYKVNSACMVHFSDGTSLSISYTPKKYTVT
ncbi:MAG: leucine-rich repeat domain-containing protein, partial [Ruminococcus sp.]|nr:leucine-rich repeat domain-containing protein [Ruminococcus sp.]